MGSKEPRGVDFFSSRLRDFIEAPSVTTANILPNGGIEVEFSQGVLTEEVKQNFVQNFYKFDDTSYKPVGFPIPCSSQIKMKQYSPSRNLLALVRKPTAEENGKVSDLIEIWDQDRLLKVIHCKNCGDEEKSEQICVNPFFGGLQWSPDEKYLLFTTIRDRKDGTSPFYDVGRGEKKEFGNQFLYEESWGNSMEDIYYTSLWVARVEGDDCSFQVRKVNSVPADLNVAHPLWTPGGKGIVFVGQKRYERRLGHIYCTNRSAGLYHVVVDTQKLFSSVSTCCENEPTLISENCEEDFGVRYPSFDPKGSSLIYHSSTCIHAHSSCARLRKIDWNNSTDYKKGTNTTIVDVQNKLKSKDQFPGIFNRESPQHNNFTNAKTTIIPSYDHGRRVLLLVNIDSGDVQVFSLGLDFVEGSYHLLDCFGGLLLVSYSTPSQSPEYFVTQVGGACVDKILISPSEQKTKHLAKQEFQLITTKSSLDSGSEFESVLLSPIGKGKYPLLAYPHGGPHSWTGVEFVSLFSYFVSIGYHVLLTNYRGSVGYGEDTLKSLFGNCGTMDIQDVMDAINQVCELDTVDENRVVIGGGSHGGFITGHLLGKFPNRFKAGIMRNPVTNLASKISGSDIPDLTQLVACGAEEGNGFPGDDGVWQGVGRKEAGVWLNEDKILTLYRASPIAFVQNVVAPTIIIIGSKDKRVPNYQGQEFYYNLKSRGVQCKILSYDDPHAITQIHFAYDAWMNISLWLEQFTQN